MPTNGLLVDQLSQVITQAIAPAFLLGATAAFVAVLIGRLNRIADRFTTLVAIKTDDPAKGRLQAAIARLKRRARLMNKAIEFAVISGVFTTLLVIVAFISAALGLHHAYGAALLFVLALSCFSIALVHLWIEIRIAVNELDDFL